jgi:chorismate mutase
MMVRGIRGANKVSENTRTAIHDATRELIIAVMQANDVESRDIASIFLTATPDLNADFPAYAVRKLGFSRVPLLCASEIDVEEAPKSLIRILMHVNTNLEQDEIKHVYLGDTSRLRPDLFGE